MKCKRCGKCCIEAHKLIWINNLTWEEKQIMLAERVKYPENKTGCQMYYGGGCLIETVLGKDKKPVECQNYFCGANDG